MIMNSVFWLLNAERLESRTVFYHLDRIQTNPQLCLLFHMHVISLVKRIAMDRIKGFLEVENNS